MKIPVAGIAALAAFAAGAGVADFTRAETRNWNGCDGVRHVKWTKSGGAVAHAFAFDLSKGYRLRAWYGATDQSGANKATVGDMAGALAFRDGVSPVAGINGDYFDTGVTAAHPTGLHVSEGNLLWTGNYDENWVWGCCFLAEMPDGNLYHGKLARAGGNTTGDPARAGHLAANGRKVRNAIRTNYCNYPVRGGVINAVLGESSPSSLFPTTIGNKQSRTTYSRTLVGIGTNTLGVATNLVLFSSKASYSSTFPDVDAYQMMIDLGCNEVGELDGGGSATIWAGGEYVSYEGDWGSPRAVANAIFVMPPSAALKRDWFAAEAAGDTTRGGEWTAKPDVALDGTFAVSEGENAHFAAERPKKKVSRVCIALESDSGVEFSRLDAILANVLQTEARAAIVQVMTAGAASSWRGLVRDGDVCRWEEFSCGEVAPGGNCVAAVEFDPSGSRVSYLVGADEASLMRLSSASGARWFDARQGSDRLKGRVNIAGPARFTALSATSDAHAGGLMIIVN